MATPGTHSAYLIRCGSTVFYKAVAGKRGDNASQDMWVYAGQELIGAGAKVSKGLFVRVVKARPDGLTLDNGQTLDRETASACLRLSHCITIAASQGLTLPGRVRIVESESPFLAANTSTWPPAGVRRPASWRSVRNAVRRRGSISISDTP